MEVTIIILLKKMFNKDCLSEFNFNRFISYLASGRLIIRTYYYTAPLDKNYISPDGKENGAETYTKQQKFFDKLRKISDFSLILCRMQKEVINGKLHYMVKEDDINLAVEMVKLAYSDAFDTAILVSSGCLS